MLLEQLERQLVELTGALEVVAGSEDAGQHDVRAAPILGVEALDQLERSRCRFRRVLETPQPEKRPRFLDRELRVVDVGQGVGEELAPRRRWTSASPASPVSSSAEASR